MVLCCLSTVDVNRARYWMAGSCGCFADACVLGVCHPLSSVNALALLCVCGCQSVVQKRCCGRRLHGCRTLQEQGEQLMLRGQGADCCWLLSPSYAMFLSPILLARAARATYVFYYEPRMLALSRVDVLRLKRVCRSRGCESCVKAHGPRCMCCTICGPPCLRGTLYSCAHCIHLYVVLGHSPELFLAPKLQAAF